MKRYEETLVKKYLYEILLSRNLTQNESKTMIDTLVDADKYGVYTHGLSIFSSHVERIDRGGYQIGNEPSIEKVFPAFMTVDAHNTIGFYSANFCMNEAVKKAKKVGIYTVHCKNCNTYGAAFYYTKIATDNNMVGITFCNSPSAMAPWGGCEKMLGTNPLAVGIPGDKKGPILFDMATSIVAKSKINEARKKGECIPEGWALNVEGRPTVDPIEAIRGLILPIAGPKGYGLALIIDLLAGLLSGAAYLNNVGKFYSEDNSSMNIGQVFIAINPQIILSEQFYEMVDDYIGCIKKSKKRGDNEVFYPGERKLREFDVSNECGIKLTETTVESINCLLHKLKICDGL